MEVNDQSREKTHDKQVLLEYISTNNNIADGFMQALDTVKHKAFLEGLGLVKIESRK